jgi:AbrB family looped-hinge helix DNA binding protein
MKTQAKRVATGKSVVKIGVSRQVVIPKKIHDRLGLEPGDFLEAELKDGKVVLTPQALIEKRIAEGIEDLKHGRVHGPFASVESMLRTLRRRRSENRG